MGGLVQCCDTADLHTATCSTAACLVGIAGGCQRSNWHSHPCCRLHTHTLSHTPTLQWYFQFFLQWLPMLSHNPVYLFLGGCLMELLTEMLLCAAEVWSSKREWVWVLSLANWEVFVSFAELFMCLVSKQMLEVSSVLLRRCVCFLKKSLRQLEDNSLLTDAMVS